MRLYLSTCDLLNCMSCLKQPTTICAGEIHDCLFADDVTKTYIFLHNWNNYGMEGILPPNSTPMFCRFYSTFTEVWFRSVLRSLVIWLRQSKLNVLHSALTNLRWHCRGRHFRRPTKTCLLGTRVIGPTALKVHCVVHEATASRRCRQSLFITVIVVVNVT